MSRRSHNSYSVKVGDVKVLRDKNEVHVEVQSSGDMSKGYASWMLYSIFSIEKSLFLFMSMIQYVKSG